jgi:hypothetical protein
MSVAMAVKVSEIASSIHADLPEGHKSSDRERLVGRAHAFNAHAATFGPSAQPQIAIAA